MAAVAATTVQTGFVLCPAMVSVKQGLQQCSVSAQMPVCSLLCCNHSEKWQALVLAPFSSCESTVSLACREFVQAFSSVTWDLVKCFVLTLQKNKIIIKKIHAAAVATISESYSGVVSQMVQVQKFFLPLNFICSQRGTSTYTTHQKRQMLQNTQGKLKKKKASVTNHRKKYCAQPRMKVKKAYQ